MPWGGNKRLSETDAMLLHAYSLYKASLCPCCKEPREVAHDPASEYEVDTDLVCQAGAALAKWRDGEGREAEDGVLPVLRLVAEVDGEVERVRAMRAAKRKSAAGGGGKQGD